MSILDPADRRSATWAKIDDYLEVQLGKLRARNDGDLTELQTARLRGYIACIKALLALDSDVPEISLEDRLFSNIPE